jgi:phosphate transport system permease protein
MRTQRYLIENIWRITSFLLTVLSLIILFAIVIFIFSNGFQAFLKEGFMKFVFGGVWSLADDIYGIWPLIVGSSYVTFGSLVLAVPLSLACAIFLAEMLKGSLRSLLRAVIDLLAGIPSVVYGLVGMIVIVPFIRDHLGGPGFSLLAGAIVLALMIIPTITSLAEDSIQSVPSSYREAAYSSGATHWQTIWHVLLPAAKNGIRSGILLGLARSLGEAMAVYMVIGNAFHIPKLLTDPSRTLTSNIVGQIEEAVSGSPHMHALFACGMVLLIIVFAFNSYRFLLSRKEVKHEN